VLEVLESNRLTAGPMMARFEQELAALKEVHGWQDGDEVLVPAITFIATSNAVLYNDLRPVFVDVEPGYYTIDPSKIEARLTPRTRCVLPVQVGGLPCDHQRSRADRGA